MISGCNDVQTSMDATINNTNQGAMTWAFLEAFKSEKNITWRNLLIKMRNLFLTNQHLDDLPRPPLVAGYCRDFPKWERSVPSADDTEIQPLATKR